MHSTAQHEMRYTEDLGTRYASLGDSNKPTIIMVHGFRGDHNGLLPIARSVSQDFNVIVPDLPGFGGSKPLLTEHTLNAFANWLSSFIDEICGKKDFHLLGHSFGSLVVANAVGKGIAPKTLTLINPISEPALTGSKKHLTLLASGFYAFSGKLPEKASRKVLSNPFVVRLMSEVMAKTTDPQLRSWIHEEHRNHFSDFYDSATLLETYQASISHTVQEFLAGMNYSPVLLIAGELDDISSPVSQLTLARLLNASRVKFFSDSGHLVHYEQAVQTAQEIASFIGAHN